MSSQLIIASTFLLAMILSVVSLPQSIPIELAYVRPEWITLVLIYWVIALPKRIGMRTAWIVGILTDVLLGTLLGQHALIYMLVAYISYTLYQRLRMMPIWQQSLFVFAIILLSQILNFWAVRITGVVEWTSWYFLSSVISSLMWPWIFMSLRLVRRRFNII